MAEFDQTSFNSIHPFLDKVTIALVAGLLREQEHQVTDGADLMKLVEKRSAPFKGSLQYVFCHATEIPNSLQKLHADYLTSPIANFTKDVVNDTKF